ncbi:MAG: class II glutamine amidotransferase [Saprospiraceae bacterium]|nr:class II glutamine amidotransferase [Saprospiraceae bacterium]
MCRLYGFISSHPRKVECELIRSQNSLMAQSHRDTEGHRNPDGWGLGAYKRSVPYVVKQVETAAESEDYRWTASETMADRVISHIRRATVGNISRENTHPFVHDDLMLAHNGHIEHFDKVRERLLGELTSEEATWIEGTTDSEHILALVHHHVNGAEALPLREALVTSLQQIIAWCHEVSADKAPALNVIVSNGIEMVASRYHRSLHYTVRDAIHACEVCSQHPQHFKDALRAHYAAVAIASEPITNNEVWQAVPNKSVLRVGPDLEVELEEGCLG